MVAGPLARLNGHVGTLLELKPHGWHVRLDGRGKWLVQAAFLERPPGPRVDLRGCSSAGVVGTWDGWREARHMTWDEDCSWFSCELLVGGSGHESFQIVVDEEKRRRLHPDAPDASPHAPSNVCGPDGRGHGKNWTIGKHPKDEAAMGHTYKVWLKLNADGSPRMVDWARTSSGAAKAPQPSPEPVPPARKYDSVSIAGTWLDWIVQEMRWEEDRRCYLFEVPIVNVEGWESFQLLVNGDWRKCLHPDRADGNLHQPHRLLGPDDRGHGKNWSVGMHPLERAAPGDVFEVRLHLKHDGSAHRVDWARAERSASSCG